MDGSSEQVPVNELYGGARIAYIFNQDFARKLSKIGVFDKVRPELLILSLKHCAHLPKVSDQELRTTIRNCIGMKGGVWTEYWLDNS